MGMLGACTIFRSAWLVPAAIVGGLCYGLAGLGHLMRDEQNLKETVAMFSDRFAFLVLLAVVVMACGKAVSRSLRTLRSARW